MIGLDYHGVLVSAFIYKLLRLKPKYTLQFKQWREFTAGFSVEKNQPFRQQELQCSEFPVDERRCAVSKSLHSCSL